MKLSDRIKKLESLVTGKETGPECIIFCQQSGRLGDELDTSEIVQYRHDGIIYDREPQEDEEAFTRRCVDAAKAKLLSPIAVPVLFAVTENMLNVENKTN